MGEVLRAQAEEAPGRIVHGLQLELVCQVQVLVLQTGEVALGQGGITIARGDALHVQQPGLTHEERLHLEQVVAVLASGAERQLACPLLESVAVDAKAVVAGQRLEVGILPRVVSPAGTLADGFRLLLQALRLKGGHP